MEYSEGDKKLILEIEFGRKPTGEPFWSVYSKTLRGWHPPHDKEPFNTIDQKRILKNVSSGLGFLHMSHEIVF